MDRSVPSRYTADLMRAGLRALRDHEDEINRLNVFPVPDGDTGTNLAMTVQVVCDQLARLDDGDLAQQMKTTTTGSLMGARGNSGVILSQIMRGICETIASASDVDAALLAEAMTNGVKVAYQAIRRPVEGTMLTVIRDAAEAALSAAEGGEADIAAVLEGALAEAGRSVERTPELLPELAEAGVVDAGGYGLVVFAKGIVEAALGKEIRTEELVGATGSPTAAEEADLEYQYCTEFAVLGEDLDVDALEEFLDSIGGSVMVAASGELVRIHVHTNHPGKVLEHGSALGSLDQIRINNMERQVAERQKALSGGKPANGVGIVAVANGEGVARIFESLGVDRVVHGGQTMNPSAADLAQAVESLPAASVIVLPNNSNIVLAAEQAGRLVSKQVHVVPTKTIPQGLAAVLAVDEEADAEANARAMIDAAARTKSGEITRAVRTGTAGGVKFRKGDLIGVADGSIVTAGRGLAPTAMRLIEKLLEPTSQAMTVIVGAKTSSDKIDALVARIERRHPKLDIDVAEGGQPLYPLIIGVE